MTAALRNRVRRLEECLTPDPLIVLVRSCLREPAEILGDRGEAWSRGAGESVDDFRRRAMAGASSLGRSFVLLAEPKA